MITRASGRSERLVLARRLAAAAGERLLRHFGRVTEVSFKGAVDLVTEVDEETEAVLRQGIHEAFPRDSVWAEEGGEATRDGQWRWIVDPLDGTTNYVHGIPHFAVSIGICFGEEIEAGIIHAPCRAATYWASRGEGAYVGDTRLQVSSTATLGESLLVTGFPYDRQAHAVELLGPVQRALESARGLRRHGAAALDFVDVAIGRFDGYWEPRLAPWDMAGGVLLVREAGGRVTGYGDRAFDLMGPDVVCSNARIHDALLAMIGDGT